MARGVSLRALGTQWLGEMAMGETTMKETDPLKCDACGQFIPWKDFGNGLARRALVTPDSHYSYEEYETLCAVCAPIDEPEEESSDGDN